MEFLTIMLLWLLVAGTVVFTLLFGELDAFNGTVVAKMHWLLTDGLLAGLINCIGCCCGECGVDKCMQLQDTLMTKKNPSLQIFYSFILIGVYSIFNFCAFPLLPSLYVPAYHIYMGGLLSLFTFATFVLCSVSDPGTVTDENVDHLCKVRTAYVDMICQTKTT